ncbi:MAG: oligosaccharide flippase family protein [Lachnospiraceae bacterium]|nr:oligosaccharide flippase family protein [Lachnospiraceae bacterium]
MDNNAKALKSGFWYILANMLVRAMSFITTPIFSRLLTKNEYGEYSNFLSWTSIAVIVITMRMESSLISARFDYKEGLNQYIFSALGLTTTIVAAWTIVITLFSSYFAGLTGIGLTYIYLMLLYCLFYAVILFYQVNERYHYKYKVSVLISLIISIGGTVFSIILVLLMSDKFSARALGHVLPTALIGLFLLMLIIKRGKKIDITVWPYILKVCIPYIPHLLSLQVLNSVDRIMITKICGAADNAMYTIAYSCGHIVTLLLTSMNMAFSPWLGDKLHDHAHKEIQKVSLFYMLLFCIFALGMMLLAPELLLIMGGKKYLEAKYVMTPVAMGCVCQFMYTLYVNIEQYKKKTVGMAIASVTAALINYALNALFIPKYGYIAAAYTTLFGYLVLFIIHMLIVKSLGYGDVYNTKAILLILSVMLALTIGISFLYKFSVLRYIIVCIYILILCIIAWFNKSLLINLIKKIIK